MNLEKRITVRKIMQSKQRYMWVSMTVQCVYSVAYYYCLQSCQIFCHICLQSMDDEKLAVQLNLSDFESIFELRTNEMSEEVRLKKEAGKISYSLVIG